MNFLFVFIGGGLGSLCRYGIARALNNYQGNFPAATFLANAISCIILGILLGMVLKNNLSENMKALTVVGFCGGFSTFSTFTAENLKLLQDGLHGTAILYMAASLIVCLIFLYLGIKLYQIL